MRVSTSSLREKLFALLAITIIIFVVYHGVFLNNYAFSDDYPFLSRVVFDNSINGYFKNLLSFTTFGRPVTGAFIDLGFSFCGSIDNLKYMRIITLVGISLFSMALFVVVREQRWPLPLALFFSISAVMLPSFQVYAAWTQYFPFPFALVIALYAGKIAWSEHSESSTLKRLLTSLLLISISMMIHQSAAMMFWFFPALSLNSGKEEKTKNIWHKTLCSLTIVGIAGIMNKLLMKLPAFVFDSYRATERGSFVVDIQGKMAWFFEEPLLNALNLWNINVKLWVGIIPLVVIILFGILILSSKSESKYSRLAAMTVIIPLSYLPNLAISENWASYRSLSVLAIIILLYCVASVKNLSDLIRDHGVALSKHYDILTVLIGLFALMLICSKAANNVNIYFAKPQKTELNMMRNELNKIVVLGKIHKINLCKADWYNTLAKKVKYDEFGLPSLCQYWTPAPMTKLILNENRYKYLSAVKIINSKDSCHECFESDECYSIDLNGLLLQQKAYIYKTDI